MMYYALGGCFYSIVGIGDTRFDPPRIYGRSNGMTIQFENRNLQEWGELIICCKKYPQALDDFPDFAYQGCE